MVASSTRDPGNACYTHDGLFTNDRQCFSRPAGVKNHYESLRVARTIREHRKCVLVHGAHELARKVERKRMSVRDENRHLDIKREMNYRMSTLIDRYWEALRYQEAIR